MPQIPIFYIYKKKVIETDNRSRSELLLPNDAQHNTLIQADINFEIKSNLQNSIGICQK